MKEKTFEKLIEETEAEIFLHGYKYYSVHEVNNLLQQVREATITECHLIADKYYFQNSEKIIIDINSLPTDRIKLTEK